jgi:tRNA threonylcarbamoyladenosine biosynthesis protein TsaB
MLLLSIDTSIRGCSVAVHSDKVLLANYELLTDKSSSSMLTSLIKASVEHAGYTLSDLDAIAVAKGPGSYTGLRVGVSAAKGLCYGLDKPLIAINTLQAMALQVAPFFKDYWLCPMIDARRMEVYAAIFNQDSETVLPTTAIILNEHSLAEELGQKKIVFFGDGAAKCKVLFSSQPNAIFVDTEIYPSARTVGMLAAHAFAQTDFEDVATFEPYYLKDFMGPIRKKATVL